METGFTYFHVYDPVSAGLHFTGLFEKLHDIEGRDLSGTFRKLHCLDLTIYPAQHKKVIFEKTTGNVTETDVSCQRKGLKKQSNSLTLKVYLFIMEKIKVSGIGW